MKRAANLKYREYIRETVAEYQRRGNFIRIYPAKDLIFTMHYSKDLDPTIRPSIKLCLQMRC